VTLTSLVKACMHAIMCTTAPLGLRRVHKAQTLICSRACAVLLTVVGKYAWARLANHMSMSRWNQHSPTSWRYTPSPLHVLARLAQPHTPALTGAWGARGGRMLRRYGAWRVLHTVDAGYNVASLMHFLHFLGGGGKYRSLPERLVRARLVYRDRAFSQPTWFEHMNRELVWHELSELLLFVLPLLSAARLGYVAALPQVGSALERGAGSGQPVREVRGPCYSRCYSPQLPLSLCHRHACDEVPVAVHTNRSIALRCVAWCRYWARRVGSMLFPQSTGSTPTLSPLLCAACGNVPKIPFLAQPCGHRYCYYCLRCVLACRLGSSVSEETFAGSELWSPFLLTWVCVLLCRARCMDDSRFKCMLPSCNAQVSSMHRALTSHSHSSARSSDEQT
jgi:hypothetical protein